MATKDEMSSEIVVFYTQFERELQECKITRGIYFAWVDKLKSYEEYRKAHKFIMTKLLKSLVLITHQLKFFNLDAWTALKLFSKNQKEVVMLRELSQDASNCWKQRPKPRRRGSE